MATPGQELSTIDFDSMLGGPLVAVINAQAQAAMTSVNFIKSVGFHPPPTEQEMGTQEVGEPIYVSFKYPKEVAPYDPGSPGTVTGINITLPGSGYDPANPPNVTISGDGSNAAASAQVDPTTGGISSITLTSGGQDYTNATVQIANAPTGGTDATAMATVDAKRAAKAAEFQEMKLEVPLLTIVPVPFIRIESSTVDFNAKINSVEYTKTDTSLKVDATLTASARYGFVASAKLKVSTSYQRNTERGTNVQRTYSMAVHIRAVQDEMPAGLERILGILEGAIIAQPASLPKPTGT